MNSNAKAIEKLKWVIVCNNNNEKWRLNLNIFSSHVQSALYQYAIVQLSIAHQEKRGNCIKMKWKKDFNYFFLFPFSLNWALLFALCQIKRRQFSIIFLRSHFLSARYLFIHWLVNMPRFPSHNDDDEVILYPFENKLDTHIYCYTTTILSIILLHSIFEHSFYHPR